MFFALFGITNRAVSTTSDLSRSSLTTQQSSIIGPNVIQAIINDTNNNWMGFPFLFAVCAATMIAIAFVDIEKGREDCRRFTEQRKVDRVVAESGLSADALVHGKCVVEDGETVGAILNGPVSNDAQDEVPLYH